MMKNNLLVRKLRSFVESFRLWCRAKLARPQDTLYEKRTYLTQLSWVLAQCLQNLIKGQRLDARSQINFAWDILAEAKRRKAISTKRYGDLLGLIVKATQEIVWRPDDVSLTPTLLWYWNVLEALKGWEAEMTLQ